MNIKKLKAGNFAFVVIYIISVLLNIPVHANTSTLTEVQNVSVSHDDLLVKLKSNTDTSKFYSDYSSVIKFKKKIKNTDIDVVEVLNKNSISSIISELSSNPDIEYAHPNYMVNAFSTPTDPEFISQWGLYNIGQFVSQDLDVNGIDINVFDAWKYTMGDESVVVGVLDTGIDINDKDLKNNIYVNKGELPGNGLDDDGNGYVDDVNGWDFSNNVRITDGSGYDNRHGTDIAGIIAAEANDYGICGVAPKVKLLPLKVLGESYSRGYTSNIIEAIEYAKSIGVKIINCSFGAPENNKALEDVMKSSDVLFVCAAGNNGDDVSQKPVYPACFDLPNVISVGAINDRGNLIEKSNYGSGIHIAAPGENISSISPYTDSTSGTSVACSFVTGAAALLLSSKKDASVLEISNAIKLNAKKIESLQNKVFTGGIVDTFKAMAYLNGFSKPSIDPDFPLDGLVTDAVIDPSSPVIYYTDKANKKLYAVNYETKDTKSLSFQLPPESLAVSSGTVYVALLKGEHSSDWDEAHQQGAVAVVDAESLVLNKQYDINVDPFDLALDGEGYIYITSGSGESTYIKSYRVDDFTEVSSKGIRQKCRVEYNELFKKVYFVETEFGSTNPNIKSYSVSDGVMDVYSQSNDIHQSYDRRINKRFRLSPDGKYVFHDTGMVFSCALPQDYDIGFLGRLKYGFIDVAFSLPNNELYTGFIGKMIQTYDYTALKPGKSYNTQGEVEYLFSEGNKIIAVSRLKDGRNAIEVINHERILTPLDYPFPMNAKITDTAVHPSKPVIYMNDMVNRKVYAINTETNEKKEISFELCPYRMDIKGSELFVTLSRDSNLYELNGEIAIVDIESMTIKEKFGINMNPYNVAVLKDGSLLVNRLICPAFEGSMKIYSRDSKEEAGSFDERYSKIAYSSSLDRLYVTSDTVPDTTISSFDISAGTLKQIKNTTFDTDDLTLGYNNQISISPDEKYLFSTFGYVFDLKESADEDLHRIAKIKEYNCAVFDIENSRFYTAVGDNFIYSYDYGTFKGINSYHTKDEIEHLFSVNNELVALCKTDEGLYVFDYIDKSLLEKDNVVLEEDIVESITQSTISLSEIQMMGAYEAETDPQRPVIYLLDAENKKVSAVNYDTGETKTIKFKYVPQKIYYRDNELYVALETQKYDGSLKYSSQEGALAVIDCTDFSVTSSCYINAYPQDLIVARDGFIYVLCKRNAEHWRTYLKCFSTGTKQETNKTIIDHPQSIRYHPTMEKVYASVRLDGGSFRLNSYGINSGSIIPDIVLEIPEYPYFLERYIDNGNFKFSPDGKYILSFSGSLLISAKYQYHDRELIKRLNSEFIDVAFDIGNDRVFAAGKDKSILVYDYNTFDELGTIETDRQVLKLFCNDGNLSALTRVYDNMYAIERIALPPSLPLPEPPLDIPLNSKITDVVMNPSKPVLYMCDAVNLKVRASNIETGEKKEASVNGYPYKIKYHDNKVYVFLVDEYREQVTDVMIFDADNLEVIKNVPIGDRIEHIDIYDDYIFYSGDRIKGFALDGEPQAPTQWDYPDNVAGFTVNPVTGKIYVLRNNGDYPDHYGSLNISKMTENPDYYRDFEKAYFSEEHIYNKNITVSTDGKYLFNYDGHIYTCSAANEDDLQFAGNLGSTFNGIAFDIQNNAIYTIANDNNINCYDYDTFDFNRTITAQGKILKLFCHNNKLITLSQTDENLYYTEIIELNSPVVTPTPTETQIPTPTPTETQVPTPTATETQTPYPTPTNTGIIGDLNSDGSFNSIDFALMRMYLLGMISDFPAENDLYAGDVNDDNKINSIDFAFMRSYLLGMIDKFPKEL